MHSRMEKGRSWPKDWQGRASVHAWRGETCGRGLSLTCFTILSLWFRCWVRPVRLRRGVSEVVVVSMVIEEDMPMTERAWPPLLNPDPSSR